MIAIAIVIMIVTLVTLTGNLPSTRLNLQPMQTVCLLYIITLGIVPEYSTSLDEEDICRTAFELIFAFDEVISLGHKENVTVAQVKQYCEMESHEEKLHKLVMQSKINETKYVMKCKASKIDKSKVLQGHKGGFMPSIGSGRIESSFSEMSISSSGSGFKSGSSLGLSTDFDSFSTKPKGRQPLAATAPPKSLGIVSNFDVQGTLSLQILNQDDGHIQVQIETGENPGVLFKTHPNMNKELFSNENILGARDPNRPFPANQGGDGVGLLKWRMQSIDESMVPLTISCWPSVFENETYVSIEYEASSMTDLQNVMISVPFPALREAPNVKQVDGKWRYDSRNSVSEWSILLIDNSNHSGSMEFVVPPADSSMFFPISVPFSAANTFSGLKIMRLKSQLLESYLKV
ncbi:hypothetical protein UlMin_016646 [Ulmus minor]